MTGHEPREPFDLSSPLYVIWELTRRCSARCIHCSTDAEPDGGLDGDVSLREALSIVDELAQAGVMVLTLSGGEALFHRHWAEIAARAVARGLRVNVMTNGAPVDEGVARQLKGLDVTTVTVGLLSHEPGRHDYIRQTEGAHVQAVAAIERLVRQGVRTLVNYIPMRLNQDDALGVIDLAQRLDATAVILTEYIPGGRGSLDLALSPTELRRVLAEWRGKAEELRGRMSVLWQDCRSASSPEYGGSGDEGGARRIGCGAGRYLARIKADGTVTPCVFLPVPIGNIRRDGFVKLWERSPLLRKLHHRRGYVTGNCGACARLESCGGCRAVAYAYSNRDPLAGDRHCWVEPEPSI